MLGKFRCGVGWCDSECRGRVSNGGVRSGMVRALLSRYGLAVLGQDRRCSVRLGSLRFVGSGLGSGLERVRYGAAESDSLRRRAVR